MDEIIKTQHVESTHRKVRTPQTETDRALRSTGDARKLVGEERGRQKVQPSLGDPENAPGRAARGAA